MRNIGPASIALLAVLLISCVAFPQTATRSSVPKADKIVIVKSKREMTLISAGRPIKTYKVALGTQPVGRKERQGDHKTPEGNYFIDAKIENSRFHRALHISYPNQEDRDRAHKLGMNPGGAVEIHGVGKGFGWLGSLEQKVDWTDGCVAVTNGEIEEIWAMVSVGTPVEIQP